MNNKAEQVGVNPLRKYIVDRPHECYRCRAYRIAMYHLIHNIFTHIGTCQAKGPQEIDLIKLMKDKNLREFIIEELIYSLTSDKQLSLERAINQLFDRLDIVDEDYDFVDFAWV